jgi:hypothetical protein
VEKELENLDPALCFICQRNSPLYIASMPRGEFKLCKDCVGLVKLENECRNRVKQAIYCGDRLGVFTMTLGANLLPTKIKVREIKSGKRA